MPKQKKYLGKPMSHWEHEAKKLIVEVLLRASALDTRSIIGEIAHNRLVELAKSEDPDIYNETIEDRKRCLVGIANIINGVTGGPKISITKRGKLKQAPRKKVK